MLLQIGGSKLRSSLNSLKTDFTQENYYFPVIIIDMYHKKETCWTNIIYVIGPNFLLLRILIFAVLRFHKVINKQTNCMKREK